MGGKRSQTALLLLTTTDDQVYAPANPNKGSAIPNREGKKAERQVFQDTRSTHPTVPCIQNSQMPVQPAAHLPATSYTANATHKITYMHMKGSVTQLPLCLVQGKKMQQEKMFAMNAKLNSLQVQGSSSYACLASFTDHSMIQNRFH